MIVRVDYRCDSCRVQYEQRVPSPPAAAVPCRMCGAHARRVWSTVTFIGGRARTGGRADRPATPANTVGGMEVCLPAPLQLLAQQGSSGASDPSRVGGQAV